MNSTAPIGIIGGTGLGEALLSSDGVEALEVETPFGAPSSAVHLGEWAGRRVAFIARHGPGHVLPPSAVPYRANIFALKSLGVNRVIASGATGSLREHIRPRDLVVVDQVIDRTVSRASTFFEDYLAVHVELTRPMCPHLRELLAACRARVSTTVHDRGVYVCMEGPQFSTTAESHMHRSWGGDLIGMTCMPEARLAREAEMCYALVALPTDYDAWRPHQAELSPQALLEEIGSNLKRASDNAVQLIREAIARIDPQEAGGCGCRDALALAIWSDRAAVDTRRLEPLRCLLDKYIDFD